MDWRHADCYSVRERLGLEYAERMTLTDQQVDEAFSRRLLAEFSEAELVELTAGIAMENFRSKFNNALGVAAQGFCVLPGT
ncbi:MAG: carboxymuconolactone decarboxylase family protein [Gammaproteobacteria bacterium]